MRQCDTDNVQRMYSERLIMSGIQHLSFWVVIQPVSPLSILHTSFHKASEVHLFPFGRLFIGLLLPRLSG